MFYTVFFLLKRVEPMEEEKNIRLLYFGEIHEKIKIVNCPRTCANVTHGVAVKITVCKHGLTISNEQSTLEVSFKG